MKFHNTRIVEERPELPWAGFAKQQIACMTKKWLSDVNVCISDAGLSSTEKLNLKRLITTQGGTVSYLVHPKVQLFSSPFIVCSGLPCSSYFSFNTDHPLVDQRGRGARWLTKGQNGHALWCPSCECRLVAGLCRHRVSSRRAEVPPFTPLSLVAGHRHRHNCVVLHPFGCRECQHRPCHDGFHYPHQLQQAAADITSWCQSFGDSGVWPNPRRWHRTTTTTCR